MSSPRSSPHDGASDLEHLVQDFEKRAAQSLRAEGATCIETQLQDLLIKIRELSDDVQRLTGGWSAAPNFRAWNQCPTTARDPSPLAVKSFRDYKQGKSSHGTKRIGEAEGSL